MTQGFRLSVQRFRTASLAVIFLSLALSARGQDWKLIHQFASPQNGYVSDAYFFNPNVGLVGFYWANGASTQGLVQRTTDGGVTWTNSTIPALTAGVTPFVTDIWFSDSLNGWITISSDKNTGDPLLWHSTDGGKSWKGVPTEPALTGPTAVRKTPAALTVVEGLGVGIWTSTDSGTTWTSHANQKNGLDFEDDNVGIATEYGEHDPSSTFLYTSDGGLNWIADPGGLQHEGWGVYAIKHGQIFVCVPEDTTLKGGVSAKSPIMRSTNNGLDWTMLDSLPIRTTGDVEGVDGVIYVQNCGGIVGSPHGLFRSLDSGQTWTNVGGPNSNDGFAYTNTDTRFAVTGCGDIVYAGDGEGGLWKTVDGGDSANPIPQCNFADTDASRGEVAIICDTSKNLFYLHNTSPNPGGIEIQSLSIYDTTSRPDTTGAVYLDSVPIPYTAIAKDDSVAFGLAWHPGAMMDSAASDYITIRVIYLVLYFDPTWGLNPYDTIYVRVNLAGLSVPAEFTLSTKSITKDTIPICTAIDSTVLLINDGCDSLEFLQATLQKNNWTITNTSGKPLALPIEIPRYDTVRIQFHASPTSATVLFDSLEGMLRYEGHDTTFGIGLRTSAKLDSKHPALTIDTLINFDSLATCDTTVSLMNLANTGCDTITITQADLTDSHFELLDTNGNPLKLPLTIPTDSVRQVLIQFTPKTLTTSTAPIKFQYKYYTFDSSNVATLTGTGSPSGALNIPAATAFNPVSICSFDSATITLRNSSCDSDFVDSIGMSGPFVLAPGTKLPHWISHGGTFNVKVYYDPTQKAAETGTATVVYQLNDAKTPDTVSIIQLSGTGISGSSTFQTSPSLQANTLTFDTLNECGTPDTISFAVFNTGCDTLHVTGISLDPSLGVALANEENMPLPALLVQGDSLHVSVRVSALIAGTYSGNLNLQYTLADGSQHDTAVPVSLTITVGGGASRLSMTNAVNAIDFQPFHSCQPPDSTVIFHYTGCGTISIDDSIAGTGFTISGGVPQLSNGDDDTVHISYDGSSIGNLAGTLFIKSSATTNPDYSIPITGNVTPPQTVQFNLSISQNTISERNIFSVMLTPTSSFNGSGLRTIQGMFEYPRDHFQTNGTSLSGAQPNGVKDVGGMEEYGFILSSGSDIHLTGGEQFITLQLEAMISDTVGGSISVQGLSFNGGDTTFGNCVLSLTAPQSVTTNFETQCGDSLLIGMLNGRPIVTAEDPRPNPVTSETGYQTTVNLTAAEDGVAEVKLYNALGEQLSDETIPMTAGGTVPYTFHLETLPAGSYYYAIRLNGAQAASGTLRGTFQLLK